MMWSYVKICLFLGTFLWDFCSLLSIFLILLDLYEKIPSDIEPKLLPFQREGIEYVNSIILYYQKNSNLFAFRLSDNCFLCLMICFCLSRKVYFEARWACAPSRWNGSWKNVAGKWFPVSYTSVYLFIPTFLLTGEDIYFHLSRRYLWHCYTFMIYHKISPIKHESLQYFKKLTYRILSWLTPFVIVYPSI